MILFKATLVCDYDTNDERCGSDADIDYSIDFLGRASYTLPKGWGIVDRVSRPDIKRCYCSYHYNPSKHKQMDYHEPR